MYSRVQEQRRDDHAHSLRTYLSQHRAALARFHSSGDLAQQDWADKYLHAAKLHTAIVVDLGGVVENAPELQPEVLATVETVEAAPVEQVKVRCPFYKQIRTFHAIAIDLGLDTKAKEACRAAMGMLLGRRLGSREEVTGPEWEFACGELKAGRLFW